MTNPCIHLDQIKDVTPSGDECVECQIEGTTAVALRMCLSCGHVGCCDSSVGLHATKHFKNTGHAIMQAYKSDKDWRWCYIDEVLV